MVQRDKPSTTILFLATVVFLVMLGSFYIAGYFLLSEAIRWPDDYVGEAFIIQRTYQRPWLAVIYGPAGRVESWARGIHVEIRTPDVP